MNAPTILIAGIGNIFRGDDAFGSEVARRLLGRSWPASVTIADFGIRGIDLTYALMDNYDLSILVDATSRGGAPGTVYLIEPDLNDLGDQAASRALTDPHSMDPLAVLRSVKTMGGQIKRMLLVGCEPAELGDEEQGAMGLSQPVQAAVEEAIPLVISLVERALACEPTAGQQHSA